jgi:hypothetical protein
VTAVSVAALSAYTGAQARDHRRESQVARHAAIDVTTLSLFVAALSDENREAVLRNFGMKAFGRHSRRTDLAEDGSTTARKLGLLEDAIAALAKFK